MEVDKKKARYYYELAAIGGDANARHNLGCIEGADYDRALKHFMWHNASSFIPLSEMQLQILPEMWR